MSIQRAAQVMVDRGYFRNRDDALNMARRMDSDLWSGWKSSSTGADGGLLQAAIAAELGGRFHAYNQITADEARRAAQKWSHQTAESTGNNGFDVVRAYVAANGKPPSICSTRPGRIRWCCSAGSTPNTRGRRPTAHRKRST